MLIALEVVVFIVGVALVWATVISAIKTFVLPRAARTFIARATFVTMRRIFNVFARPSRPFMKRDAVMAMFSPASLFVLAAVWYLLVGTGFAAMQWGLGVRPLTRAFLISGSSLFTPGQHPDTGPELALTLVEPAIGLALLALLISYLPTIYAAFNRREVLVALLEVLAGSPPSARELLIRHQRILGLSRLENVWLRWQDWFADVEESHTSLGSLVFFRSPEPGRSWITAAACVLDSAAIMLSGVDMPPSPEAQICIRAGYVSLRRIADFFTIHYDPDPQPTDPISIKREEFDAVLDDLALEGIPVRRDREWAWQSYVGWRVNYDTVVRALSALTMAPWAPWSSDRALPFRSVPIFRRGDDDL